MKVLIVGGGGREHALAWKAIQSRHIDELHVAPGNPGIGRFAWCHPEVKATDVAGQVELARRLGIDLVIVGPEEPLATGLVDALAEAGIRAFGPTAAAARIEASKAFAKEVMAAAGVPTASYAVFSDYDAALAYVEANSGPLVVKADGLAAGKGVRVCAGVEEARQALRAAMVEGAFAGAGRRVVIEEVLEGEEVSVLAFSDGRTVKQMVAAQDHKRVGEGDTGPNTGGMGAYAPVPFYTPAVAGAVQRTILEPTIAELARRGTPFVGCLFAGLMLTAQGPKVVEFNARFGDPETQVVLPLLENDLLEVIGACLDGRLHEVELRFRPESAAVVVLASAGYPGAYQKGLPIGGLVEAEETGATLFHAGTAFTDEGVLVTAGGRVLGVMATGPTLAAALDLAYAGVERVRFEGRVFRRDIGRRAL